MSGMCRPIVCTVIVLGLTGCHSESSVMLDRQSVDITPVGSPDGGDALHLEASSVPAMFTEVAAIDLETVVRVAAADNIDILQAREQVAASRGRLESAVGAVFPTLVPTALFEHVDGSVRATEGNIVGVGFNTFQPSIAVQWVINPGKVIYGIIAAKKHLKADSENERGVIGETFRASAIQYYDLVLTQARVSAARESVNESEELLRINRLRASTGAGVPADEMRAKAQVAERRQDLILALNQFYRASVALAMTLDLDATVTLVPDIDRLPPIALVRDEMDIDDLLAISAAFRPELERVRSLIKAGKAETGATWWGAFGPQFSVGYQYGGIQGHASNVVPSAGIPNNLVVNPLSPTGAFSANPFSNGFIREGIVRGSRRLDRRRDQTFAFKDQSKFTASATWRLSVSSFGNLKVAKASQRTTLLDAQRELASVRAEVVNSLQASRSNAELIQLARQQVISATEALRLTQANLAAGTMTTLDVLQSQDAMARARLRHAEAVVRYNQSQVNLLASLGMIGEKALIGSGQSTNTSNIETSSDAG